MDVHVEQLIKLKKNATVILTQIFLFGLALSLGIIAWMILVRYAQGSLAFPITVGLLFLAYRIATKLNLEFEYTITNEFIDIDKIVAKRKRFKVVATSCRHFEEFGKYRPGLYSDAAYAKQIIAYDPARNDVWYFVIEHKKLGKTMVLFTPSDKVLEAMKPYLPIALRKAAFPSG